jgi:glutaminase
LPTYIPALAAADPAWFAVHIRLVNGNHFSVSYVNRSFPLMSVVKPLLLLFLLEHVGSAAVFKRVGMIPSDQPFHSVVQLAEDRGFPRNPMLNSGAIALTGLLPGVTGAERCETLRQWLNQTTGCQLHLDTDTLASVRSLPNETNRSIAHLLSQAGYLDGIDTALDTYNQICCLAGTVADLSRLGLLLAQTTPQIAHPATQRTVNALMLTCGLYEASGEYAVRVGLPIKSGVSGALLAIVPGEGAIACYSPTLDAAGNPTAGLHLVEKLATEFGLSPFNP